MMKSDIKTDHRKKSFCARNVNGTGFGSTDSSTTELFKSATEILPLSLMKFKW